VRVFVAVWIALFARLPIKVLLNKVLLVWRKGFIFSRNMDSTDDYMRRLYAALKNSPPLPARETNPVQVALKRLLDAPASVGVMVGAVLETPLPADFRLPLVCYSDVVDVEVYQEHVRSLQHIRLMMTIEALTNNPLRTSVETYDSEHHDEWVAQQADPVTGEVELVLLVAALLLRNPGFSSYERLYRLFEVLQALKEYPPPTVLRVTDVPRPVSLAEMRRHTGGGIHLEMMQLDFERDLAHEFALNVRGEVARLKDATALGDATRVQEALAGFLRAQEVADDSPELNAGRRDAVFELSRLVREVSIDVGTITAKIARNIFYDTMQRLRATRVLVVGGLLMPLHPYCFTSTSASLF